MAYSVILQASAAVNRMETLDFRLMEAVGEKPVVCSVWYHETALLMWKWLWGVIKVISRVAAMIHPWVVGSKSYSD